MQEPSTQAAPSVRSTIAGAAWLSAHQLLLNALSVPAMGFIIHRLGAEGYAHWMTATSLLLVGAVVTNLGLRAAFVRRIAAGQSEIREAIAVQLGLRLILSVLVGGIVLLVCLVLDYPRTVLSCASVGAVGLVLTTFATTLADVLQGLHRIRTLAVVGLVSGVTLTGTSVVVAWTGGGALEVALAYLTGPLVSCVLCWAIVRKDVCVVTARFSAAHCRSLLKQSRHFAAQQLLFAGSGHAEALLAPRLLGMVPFGVFTAGALLANRLSILPDSLCTSAFPSLVKAWASGRAHAVVVVRKYLAFGVAGGVVVAVAGTLVAGVIGRLLMPAAPDSVAMVVRVTIWSLPLAIAELVMGYALMAAGKESSQARLALPAAVVGLASSVTLITMFGLQGACWSLLLRPAIRASFLLPLFVRTFSSLGISVSDPGKQDGTAPTMSLRKAG